MQTEENAGGPTALPDAWRAALLEASLDCVILMDSDGYVLDVNHVVVATFGHEPDAVIGKRLGDVFVPPELRPRHEAGLRRYLATGESAILGKRVEVEAMHRNGRRIPIELTIVRLRGSAPPVFVGHLRNISARKRAERRLRLAAAAADAVATSSSVDSAIDGVLRAISQELSWPLVQFWRVDPTRGVASRTHGWASSPALRDALPAMHFERGAGLPGTAWEESRTIWLEDVTASGIPLPRIREMSDAGICSAFAFPVRTGREVGGVVEAFSEGCEERDPELVALLEIIGGQLSHAVGLHEARVSLEEANASKDAFLAALSHELRTPLQPILGWAHFLERAQVDDESRMKAAGIIRRNAEAEARLVEDLLDVSRIVAGKMTIKREPVSLVAVLQSSIETVAASAASKGIDLQLCGDFEVPLVLGDAQRLQQVFSNLLVNAVKFTPTGGRISVSLQLAGESVQVSVSDTGEGIPADLLPHVFDRFKQGTRQVGDTLPGLGLGLSIVRDLIVAHGGTVSAESTGLHTGATFVVRLPAGVPPRELR